jgi:signal transduction histidine kinase
MPSCNKEIQAIPEKESDKIEIDRLIALGDHYYTSGIYDSSYYYFNKAKLACDPKKDTKQFVYSISNLATIQQNQGDFSGSETTAMEAMPILKTTTNPNYKWNIYTILAINYLNTFDYDNALYYYNKALSLKTDKPRINAAKNNIAVLYMEKNEYHKAIEILLPLTLKKEVIKDSEIFSRIIDNLGYCYFKTENPKALNYLTKSVKIREKKKDDWGVTASYFHLYFFYEKSNPILATSYAKQAYRKATLLGSVDDRLHSLQLLIKNTTLASLKKYSIDYVCLNDSITKVRLQAKNQFAKMKYDSKQEKEEILNLKTQKAENALELQLQKNTSLNLYFIVGILLTTTGFIYFYLVEKSKREKIKTSYNTEVRIAKKLHDELANDVYQTMAFVETHDLSSSDNKETLLDKLDAIYSRTRNISKENSIIPTGVDFIPHLKEMITGFDTASVTILIQGLDSVNWSSLSDLKKITLYRVLQELLINMKKHSKSSLVVLSFQKQETILQVDYTDNGLGATNEQLNSKTGLQNVENRILAIKGTITFDNKPGKGFRANIIFPL